MKQFLAKLHNRDAHGPGRRLLRTAASLVVAAAVLVTSGYAWYVRNFNLQSRSGMVLTTQGSGAYATTYTVYLYNTDFTDVVSHNAEDVRLLGFDTVFTWRNQFTPAIICIPVWGTSVTDGTPFTVNLHCSSDDSLFELDNPLTNTKMRSMLSNVIGVRCACLDVLPPELSGDMNVAFYSQVRTQLQSQEFKTFVDYSAGNAELSQWTKTDTLSFTVTPPAGDVAYIYMELDYDQLLVGTYRVQNESEFAESFGGNLSWSCEGDLVSVEFT